MTCLPAAATAAFFIGVCGLRAEVRVDPLFSDHMVVQRDAAILIRGTADAGETVKASFAEEGAVAAPLDVTVAADGSWSCVFPASRASEKAHVFRIEGKSGSREIRDVLIGDVWVCAGQSNMEFPVAREARANALLAGPWDPKVRILHHTFAGQYSYGAPLPPAVLAAMTPSGFYSGTWKTDSRESAAPASAIGYCFAKRISKETGVPVAIIDYAIGGAPIESFISAETLKRRFPAKMNGDWRKNAAIESWVRGVGSGAFANAGNSVPGDAYGPNHPFKPGFAWSAGPAKLKDFPVAGVLWYQGETNAILAADVAAYPAMFAAMIADWRAAWRNPGLPFYYVQISSCADTPQRNLWPEFRDAQRRMLSSLAAGDAGLFGVRAADRPSPGETRGPVGMAVSSDVGNERDVHPKDKYTVAGRLVRWALRDVYGKTAIEVSGPLAHSAEKNGETVTVTFGHAKGLKPVSGSSVAEVELAGIDGKFVAANAVVRGETLVVTVPRRLTPRAVRYGWKPFSRGNLVNGEGLPASTFRLDVR